MLKKPMMSVPVEGATHALPAFLGVIDLPRQVLMPFTDAILRLWEPRHLCVVDTLLALPSEQRYVVVVHRDLANSCHGNVGLLVRIRTLTPTKPQGFSVDVECLDTVTMGSYKVGSTVEFRAVTPRVDSDTGALATNNRLDDLVQSVMLLARMAKETNVEVGNLLHSMPHRRALLFRVASLLIQDPAERMTFLSAASTSRRVDIVSLFVAQALQLMHRRKERDVQAER